MTLLPLSKWNVWHKDSFHSSHLYTVYLVLAENRKNNSEFVLYTFFLDFLIYSFSLQTIFLLTTPKMQLHAFCKKIENFLKEKRLACISVGMST